MGIVEKGLVRTGLLTLLGAGVGVGLAFWLRQQGSS